MLSRLIGMAIGGGKVKKQGKVQAGKIKKKILGNHKCTLPKLSNILNV